MPNKFKEQNDKMSLALRNCLALAHKHIKSGKPTGPDDWVWIIRFCGEAGVSPSLLRESASGLKAYPSFVCENCWVGADGALTDEHWTVRNGAVRFMTIIDKNGKCQCDVCGKDSAVQEPCMLGYPLFKGHEAPDPEWLNE